MATVTPYRAANRYGLIVLAPAGSVVTLALNATNTWLAYGIIPPSTKTINHVYAYISAENGTVEAADITCEIFSATAAGAPNASIEGPVSCDGAIDGANWYQWSGLNQELTGGTQYWIVFKNADGSPATNYPTFRFGGTNTGPPGGLVSSTLAFATGTGKCHSTDGGSTWGTGLTNVFGFRVEYSDGSFDGLPFSQLANATDLSANYKVYDTRECGIRFVTRANATLQVIGFALAVPLKSGTPTSALQGRLYTGASPTGNAAATSVNSYAAGVIPTSGTAYYLEFYFSSPVSIAGGTEVRIVLSPAATGDTSSNFYSHAIYILHDDANSKAIMPFGGMKVTYTTTNTQDGSIAWTDVDTAAAPFYLILDTDGEFDAPDFPDVGNVTEDDTVDGSTGTYHEAAVGEVQSGVQFGAGGTEYTGTYTRAINLDKLGAL